MSELIPPPAQSLHIAWRGIRPGDAVLLAAAVLGGGLYLLLDLSWGRALISGAGIGLVVVLVLPYRGMRLGQHLWLRLCHASDALLTRLFPARRRQLAALAVRQAEDTPGPPMNEPAANAAASAWHPAWAAAWEQTVPSRPDASSACEAGRTLGGDALLGALAAPADHRSWWPGIVALEHARDTGPWWPGLGREGCWPKGPQTLGEMRAWGSEP